MTNLNQLNTLFYAVVPYACLILTERQKRPAFVQSCKTRTTDAQRENSLHCTVGVLTVRPKSQSQSQIFRYDQSISCLPHRPNFSDIFDSCLNWVSVVHGLDYQYNLHRFADVIPSFSKFTYHLKRF